MRTLIIILLTSFGLSSCSTDNVSKGMENLIQNQIKSTEDILNDVNLSIKHGREGFEGEYRVATDFIKIHERTTKFIDSLDGIDKKEVKGAVDNFIVSNWKKYPLEYPITISVSEDTPLSLIKLQIVNLENAYLREWENFLTFKFNRLDAYIIPNKISYKADGQITGDIGLMAYSDNMNLSIEINGQKVKCENGLGHFSIDQTKLPKGQNFVKAKIIFPDTVYTATLELIK